MNIKYLLLFPPNLTYHLLAQLNYEKEWGPASIFSKKYIDEIRKFNPDLLIKTKEKKYLKKKFKKYFVFITFNCLRPWYKKTGDLIEDFSDKNVIKKKINNKSDHSLEETLLTLNLFNEILKEKETLYLKFWNKRKKTFDKHISTFLKYNKRIIKDYFNYLKKEINQEINIPNNYFIFFIESLQEKGRGLHGACAVGIPTNKEELKEYTRTILHEITHRFSNPLLEKFGFPIKIKPGNNKNHIRKEQFAEYILNKYLNKTDKEMAKNYTYSLITDELIKGLIKK